MTDEKNKQKPEDNQDEDQVEKKPELVKIREQDLLRDERDEAVKAAARKEDERKAEVFQTGAARQFGAARLEGEPQMPSDGKGKAVPGFKASEQAQRALQTAISDRLRLVRTTRVADGEPLGPKDELEPAKDNKDVWKEFRLADMGGLPMRLPDSGSKIVIGRHADKADVVVQDPTVSRLHCEIEMRADGNYIRDLGSRYGTNIIRNGRIVPVDDKGVKLEPGDTIRIGEYGSTQLAWAKPGAPQEKWKPTGYQPERLDPTADAAKRDQADPAASEDARRASNQYLRYHEYSGRIPNGFQVVGGLNQIDERGMHPDKGRPSYVIDLRPGKDPARGKWAFRMLFRQPHSATGRWCKPSLVAKEKICIPTCTMFPVAMKTCGESIRTSNNVSINCSK